MMIILIDGLFGENKKDELIKELNILGDSNKKEAIKYLKEKNEKDKEKIDEIDALSTKQKKIDTLVSVLGGKKEKKADKKEKLKKIGEILLGLDKEAKKECINYMRNTTQDDDKKNDELYSIIESVMRKYMNIQFYIGDEQIARHANAGNARIERRLNPVAR